ncbi:polysaccharide deacetylase family protein [Glaciecola sp. XM2]|uniref:polysaccharide deacetylase family protein n=1 Tax=Glaciecola sp. XM2 TaxID=1914931 RepID=UPI001BDE2664|nr:polysaccharide deacetylase family protein [Glaciecola sp. XM2]MBT1450646.1 polysaccharide deacetylase family protein [Glaciecola sp. XM2]
MIKKAFINALALQPLVSLGSKLYQHKVPVFMLHRMACADLGISGHSPELLRQSLSFLRTHNFNFVTIDDVARAISTQSTLPPKSVAFTIDDGYLEQVEIATNIFAEFDCPATFYVCTGFVEGDLWFWADKVHFLLNNCNDAELNKVMAVFSDVVSKSAEKSVCLSHIIEYLKTCPLDRINNVISAAAAEINLSLPVRAPNGFQATSWESLRASEKRGMMVGAHTYSHPILSNESENVSEFEIKQSTIHINEQLHNPSKVFCYPVGRQQDFSKREVAFVKRLGYTGAISSEPGAANIGDSRSLFSIPRFSYPDTKEDFIQYATWIESFKSQFRPT